MRPPVEAGAGRRCVSASSTWPLPSTPAIARTSPRAQLKTLTSCSRRRRPRRAGDEVLQREQGGSGRRAFGAVRRPATSRPTIMRARLCPGGARCRRSPDHLAVAQHDDLVADLQHLAQLVRDEDDRLALRPQPAHHVRAGRATSGGLRLDVGSSRTSRSAPRISALRISTRWRCRAAAADHRLGIKVEAVGALARADQRRRRAAAQPAAGRSPAEHDVLGHRHRIHQHEMLVDHADAGAMRVARRSGRRARGP